jgi:hypothetical protein
MQNIMWLCDPMAENRMQISQKSTEKKDIKKVFLPLLISDPGCLVLAR